LALVELKRVGMFSLGKIFAVVWFIFYALLAIFVLAYNSVLGGTLNFWINEQGGPVFFLAEAFIGSIISGFIFGVAVAFLYNIIARLVGGIEVTFTKKEAPGALPARTTGTAGAAAAAAGAVTQPKTSGVATAVNAELLSYLKGELAAGRPKEEVVADLVKAGWTQDDIHAALNAAVLG
jgi:hypothetical protein